MSEKVKLPKDVCDALDYAKDTMHLHDYSIVFRVVNEGFVTEEVKILNEQNPSEIMRALVLGYEPEMTAEEQIKELFKNPPSIRERSYRRGISDALRIHGIHYVWLDGDAE